MDVGSETRVADVATEYPGTIRVFQRYGIDFCCGGKRALSEVCDELEVELGRLKRDLDLAVAGPRDEGPAWQSWSMAQVITGIVDRYHRPQAALWSRLAQPQAAGFDLVQRLGRFVALLVRRESVEDRRGGASRLRHYRKTSTGHFSEGRPPPVGGDAIALERDLHGKLAHVGKRAEAPIDGRGEKGRPCLTLTTSSSAVEWRPMQASRASGS